MPNSSKNFDFLAIIAASMVFTYLLTHHTENINVENYHQAEQACVSLGSHVLEFDRNGEAVCENKAMIDYVLYAKEKK